MMIDWDEPIPISDGLVLRADLFMPTEAARFPLILSYGPYGKGLAFQDGYPDQWRILSEPLPRRARGSNNTDANWEVADP